jgi:hypothetical protein
MYIRIFDIGLYALSYLDTHQERLFDFLLRRNGLNNLIFASDLDS